MTNYSEITASAETDSDYIAGFVKSVLASNFSHFITISPAIDKKQGDTESKAIHRYIWFKLYEYQSSELDCIDCNTAGIF